MLADQGNLDSSGLPGGFVKSKRHLSASMLALCSACLVVSAISASPATAAERTKLSHGPVRDCVASDQYCGDWLEVDLASSYWPNYDNVSYRGTATLRNAKGKRIKIQHCSGDEEAYCQGSTFRDNDLFTDFGPMYFTPTNMKSGRYTLKLKLQRSGVWECSPRFHEVCRWQPGFKKTFTFRFKYKAHPPHLAR